MPTFCEELLKIKGSINLLLALTSLVGNKNTFNKENHFRLNWLAIVDATEIQRKERSLPVSE